MEALRLAEIVGTNGVHQVHLGGGSPTFLRSDQLKRLWEILSGQFAIASGAEIAVEIDPRSTKHEQLATLRGMGFNRFSLGVHDFSAAVQLQAVETDLAIDRGLRLSHDDRLRREVLQQLYGDGVIDKEVLQARFGIEFDAYFSGELERLRRLAEENLVSLDAAAVRLTAPLGRLLVRVVAAVFDAYLPKDAYREGLPAQASSKVG